MDPMPPGVEDHEDLSMVIDNSADSSGDNFYRSSCLIWVEGIKEEESYCAEHMVEDRRPKFAPDYLVLYTDLVEAGWGWKRLVPCRFGGCVKMPDFKSYLVCYYHKNTDKKVDEPVGKDDALLAAVNQCVEAEYELIRTCHEKFTLHDFLLSRDIRDRAKQLLQSGCESSAAIAALQCITKEDELLCQLFTRQDISEALFLANVVRRSASNLMLFKGSEYDADAAAGIMLGLTREAEEALLALNSVHDYARVHFVVAVECGST